MALAFTGTFTFVDSKGKDGFTVISIPTTFNLVDMRDFVRQAAQAITDISGCQVTGASITLGLTLPGGLRTVASIASDIARKAFLQYRTAAAGFFNKLKISTFDETKRVAGSDDIDQADIDVAALVSVHEVGIPVAGPATMTFVNDRIMVNSALAIAEQQFMKKK
ncbi:MAG: hypothetical protein J3T61_10655 [Candidatus Brocadiales bacterium]|nr:hypothetical protein [Candidatus Bathyanammoxibius sp.]